MLSEEPRNFPDRRYRYSDQFIRTAYLSANIRYGNGMSRSPDPRRKPELVAQILDFLLDKSLSGLTFRTLAAGLGVSTFTLVYHFGTRAELLSEIVAAISGRETGILENMVASPTSVDAYFDGLESSWQWTLQPRNRQLQRLEFEAAMIEALDPEGHLFVRKLFARWQRIGCEALVSFGIPPEDAEEESRLIVDTFYGIQFDLVLNGDERSASDAFARAVAVHRERIGDFLGQSV
jgi:AcrR family transcriptional regulator